MPSSSSLPSSLERSPLAGRLPNAAPCVPTSVPAAALAPGPAPWPGRAGGCERRNGTRAAACAPGASVSPATSDPDSLPSPASSSPSFTAAGTCGAASCDGRLGRAVECMPVSGSSWGSKPSRLPAADCLGDAEPAEPAAVPASSTARVTTSISSSGSSSGSLLSRLLPSSRDILISCPATLLRLCDSDVLEPRVGILAASRRASSAFRPTPGARGSAAASGGKEPVAAKPCAPPAAGPIGSPYSFSGDERANGRRCSTLSGAAVSASLLRCLVLALSGLAESE
mmetsp:Transcript_15442/g.58454  ORF Transcript_15442/g.58454 Transcript_15442/m.58454 type:complete len:284 (+) Transcript_15442:354-1205(+)